MKPWREAVRVVLRRDDDILLVKHHKLAGYTLPGGGVEEGESVEQAVRREMREELSLCPQDFCIDFVSPRLHYYEYPDDDQPYRGQKETVVVATLNSKAQPVKDGHEILKVRFAPVEKIPYDELREAALQALKDD